MRKNMTASFVIIALVALAASAGTLAYFTDSETSTGNTFTAGTMDIVLVDGGTATFTEWVQSNMVPGEPAAGGVLDIYNVGQTEASQLLINFDVNETELGAEDSDTLKGATGMSKLIKVKVMSYNEINNGKSSIYMIYDGDVKPDYADTIQDFNNNGHIDLDDLTQVQLAVYAPPPVAGTDSNVYAHTQFNLDLMFVDDSISAYTGAEKNNDYQGDQTELLVHFKLNQIDTV